MEIERGFPLLSWRASVQNLVSSLLLFEKKTTDLTDGH